MFVLSPLPTPYSLQVKKMSSCSRALLLALALALSVVEVASAETLCGGELVDALQFVCEDRGFYFSTYQVLLYLYDFYFCMFPYDSNQVPPPALSPSLPPSSLFCAHTNCLDS